MATLSVTSAFGAGFRLIGRNPLAPLVWGLVGFLITSPIQIYQLVRMPAFMQDMQASPSLAEFGRFALEIGGMILVGIPLGLLSGAVLAAACTRAVLYPDDRRFFHLRLGRTELWLLLINLCLIIGYLACMAGGVFGLIEIMRAGTKLLGGAGGALGFFVGIAFWQVLLWLLLRFSFSLPMTVRDRRPHFLASWAETRPVGWKLLGLFWLLFLFSLVVALAIGVVVGIATTIAMLGAGAANPEYLRSFGSSPLVLGINVVIGALLGGYFAAILLAPFVDLYRQVVGVVGAEEVF